MDSGNQNENEERFHDRWAEKIDIATISPEKYFTAPTAVEGRFALEIIGSLEGKGLLDLGCGFGEASIWFALGGANVTALDISSRMLDCVGVLARKYKVDNLVNTVKASAESMPFESESFDLVFGGNVLHHTDIVAVSKELWRILKPGAKAVFVEPLAYNPLINIYRNMARDVRTDMERPFTFGDIRTLGEGFSKVSHKEFQLLTTLIFVWFFLGERLHPNKVRYWKRFIEKGEDYADVFNVLRKIDESFILRLPFINRYCWNTVVELVK